ncbi:hypothetical protein C4D60_Mb05t01000 [Musa balbisiana]|uniref:non-specific serine/threonine protein kinase n=1 Tax=Musa balbisiana TaxID=52838 RepID=A0A4S8JSS8_MUSBA|nr:hypothetical protein C4D60_Mb05t01000 [Musa balbisiana]
MVEGNTAGGVVAGQSLKARYFFQQLICGVSYCHFRQICHRDLKLENTLLDGSPAPRLKICDFGYSKSSLLHSRPKSTVGTPAYIAPEVLSRREYDGKRIMSVQYKIPDHVHISQDCKQLISRIFVANPMKEAARDAVIYHYKHATSGFSAKLTQSQVEQLSKVKQKQRRRERERDREGEKSMDEEVELDQDLDALNKFMTSEMDRRFARGPGS